MAAYLMRYTQYIYLRISFIQFSKIGFKPEIISFDEFMKATREINPTDYNYMVCVVTQSPFYFIFDPSQPICRPFSQLQVVKRQRKLLKWINKII